MGVEVSNDRVVTTGVEKKVKNGHGIEQCGGIVDVEFDGVLFDDGCYEEEFGSDGEEGISEKKEWMGRRVQDMER